MIELPEAVTLASQLTETVQGKRIAGVIAGHSPHKWAWFHGDPDGYDQLLSGKSVGRAVSHGGFVDVEVERARLVFAEGVALRFHEPGAVRPEKHQLLVEFGDSCALSGSVRMYGGLWAFDDGEFDNPYFEAARAAPSPLSDDFDRLYFDRLVDGIQGRKLSVKAFLATEQRVPGLGNGVLQDILFEAGIHPKRKMLTLGPAEMDSLFKAVRLTLAEMTRLGGRDTENDLHGRPGGYKTKLSRNTVGQECPKCGGTIEKARYMGGSIYFCAGCQV